MTVTAADIEMMKSLMIDDNGPVARVSGSVSNISAIDDRQQNINAMADLLHGFHEVLDEPIVRHHVTKTAYDFVDQAMDERNVREAILTVPTKTGFKYGSYELIEDSISPNRSEYKIVSNSTIVAENMMLRESALGIMRDLNNGSTMNSKNIVMLLNEEQKFCSAVQDMRRFKARLKQESAKCRESYSEGIYEARYDKAKQDAIDAKNRAAEILRTIRSQ